ncbi:MAG TPA: class I SAM-dependent methyltransferase [Polyangiales bacterium]
MTDTPPSSYDDEDDYYSWDDDDSQRPQAEPTTHWSPEQIAQALRDGQPPPDSSFDRLLPPSLRQVSRQHWTPLHIAVRAATWLDAVGVSSVVDIGAGPGKFCVAAALAGNFEITGLEQRPRLLAAARELARTFAVDDRVSFVQGALGEVATPLADAYYLYNPFGENLFGCRERVDEDVELGRERYDRDVATIELLLRHAPVGTYVLTYNGFGGKLPASYREVRSDSQLPNVLRLCRKVRRNAADSSSEREAERDADQHATTRLPLGISSDSQ